MASTPLLLSSSTHLGFIPQAPYPCPLSQITFAQPILRLRLLLPPPLHHRRHHHHHFQYHPHGRRQNRNLWEVTGKSDLIKDLSFSGHLLITRGDQPSIINDWDKNIRVLCRKIRSFLSIFCWYSVRGDKIQQSFRFLRFISIALSLFLLLGARSAALASSHQYGSNFISVSVSISDQKDNGATVSRSASVLSHLDLKDNQILNKYSTEDNDLGFAEQREYLKDEEKDLESSVGIEYSVASARQDSESNAGTDVSKNETVLNEQEISKGYEDGPTPLTENENENIQKLDNLYVNGNMDSTSTQQPAQLQDAKDMDEALQSWCSRPYMLTVPLRVVSLRGSVPPIWIQDFRLSQGKRARTTVETQGNLDDIMSALLVSMKKKQINPRSIMAADVVTIGDSWLQFAVSKGLIEPIENAEQYDWFQRLSSKWQAYLRRDQEGRIDEHGQIWGVPYRCGSMVVAFRKDKLSRNNVPGIEDWEDLWRPELTGRIAMVDSSREVVGAVLKSLGASYNACDFEKEVEGGREAVKQRFIAFRKQVRLFDSTHYLKALASDDVWVAIGWSSDVIPTAKRMSNMRVIAPRSGTSLWADLWVIPAASAIPTDKIGSRVYRASPLLQQWFDFCLQPARTEPFRQGVHAGSSPLSYLNDGEIMKDDQDNIGSGGPTFDTNLIEGIPPKITMEKSEFLEPLSDKGASDYEWLFAEVKQIESQGKGFLKLG